MNRSAEFSLLTAVLGLALAASATARTGDREQPMEVQADSSSAVLTGDGEVTLTGRVRIDQGSLQIRADRAVVVQKDGEIASVRFEGAPATLSQQADDGARTRAEASNINYDLGTETVVLTGSVLVQQPRGELAGERVVYDLATEQLEADGSGGPIRMLIQPKTADGG